MDTFGILLDYLDPKPGTWTPVYPQIFIDSLKKHAIFQLQSPEFGGTWEENKKVIHMLQSTDDEMVKLGCIIMRQILGYGKMGNRDGCI